MLSSDDACSSKWTPRKLCPADRGREKHDGRLLAGRVQKLSAQSETAWVQIEDKRGHHGAHPGAYREAARLRIGALLDQFTPDECANYLRAAGYGDSL